jgi:spore coat protein A, manganese oxidase
MSRLAQCIKLGTKLFFAFALASLPLCPNASAQLTSCDNPNKSSPCIQRFVDQLPYPPFMASTKPPQFNNTVDAYEIAARQFQAPVASCSDTNLSSGCTARLPKTTVWGYGQTATNPNGFPYDYNAATKVCAANGTDTDPCFFSPAPTILTVGTGVHVKWINDVVCHTGDTGCTVGQFITYPDGVRPSFTNHTSNPTGICDGKALTPQDCKGVGGYHGPVPLVVHAHGEDDGSESDGIPEAWNLPTASSFDKTIYPFAFGSDYCQANLATFDSAFKPGRETTCDTTAQRSYGGLGASKFAYPNRQFGTALFFHDHALGVTTENVYMGLAGFYLIAGATQTPSNWCDGNFNSSSKSCPAAHPFNFSDDLPSDCSIRADGNCLGVSPAGSVPSVRGGLPQGDCTGPGIQAKNCFFIPLAIADRAICAGGSQSTCGPAGALKFSENGNVIVVNGKTWPKFDVQPRKYRFRIVIAAPTSRFDLTFPSANNDNPGAPIVTMTQIGADGGFLPSPATITKLSLMPGERADVIVDFQQFFGCAPPYGPGCTVDLLNANGSGDTGTIMRFNIVPFAGCDLNNPDPATCTPFFGADTSCNLQSNGFTVLSCTSADTLPHRGREPVSGTRQVSLFDDHLGSCGALNANTKCVSSTPLPWDGPVTETPTVGTTEIWEMWDFQDPHPMHIHEGQFEVVNRENMTTHVVYNCTGTAKNALGQTVNCASPPVPGETGFKDTVQANGGQITRIRMAFQGPKGPASDPNPERNPGLFAWHCHINPHEDNEMMRPMCVLWNDPAHVNDDNRCLAKQ